MTIATKTGDRGTTRFFSGEEVSKSHPRLAAYGTLDELVSALGLARSLCRTASVVARIHELQQQLFILGAELATPDVANAPFPLTPISAAHVATLDAIVTDIESRITLPRAFIIPGGCTGSAALDVARTVCRRLERHMVTLRESQQPHSPPQAADTLSVPLTQPSPQREREADAPQPTAGLVHSEGFDNGDAIRYINRFSDVCFLLARDEEQSLGVSYEPAPTQRGPGTGNRSPVKPG